MLSDLPISFIAALLSGIALFSLLALLRLLYDIITTKKPVLGFWDRCLRSPVSIVVPTYSDENSLFTSRTISSASAKVESLLCSFHKKPEEIKIFEAIDVHNMEENVILIGGPISNEITRKIMQFFKVPFYFENHVLNCCNRKYEPKLDENGDILEDYAFILKTKNPYNNKKNFIVIAGCYVYGCISGVIAVTDRGILRNIYRKAKRKSVGVIIKSHVINNIPQKPFLLEVFEIEDEITVRMSQNEESQI